MVPYAGILAAYFVYKGNGTVCSVEAEMGRLDSTQNFKVMPETETKVPLLPGNGRLSLRQIK